MNSTIYRRIRTGATGLNGIRLIIEKTGKMFFNINLWKIINIKYKLSLVMLAINKKKTEYDLTIHKI